MTLYDKGGFRVDLEVGRYLKLRQAIHQEPELGYHEFETTKKLQEFYLRKDKEAAHAN